MISSFPDISPTQIIVDVPHWIATVDIIDNDLRPLRDLGKVKPLDGNAFAGRVSVIVPPGAYEVQVTLDGKRQAQWVMATGAEVHLPRDSWDALTIESAIPMPAAAPTTMSNDRISQFAVLASHAQRGPVTAAVAGQEARLTLLGTALGTGDDRRPFDFDVTLFDAGDKVVARLGSDDVAIRTVARQLWRCSFDVPPGYYVLATPLPGMPFGLSTRYRRLPLFLCCGMETHLFMRCDGPPDLATATQHLTSIGGGFDPMDDEVLAADQVLTALGNGDTARLLGSERLQQLVSAEHRNPWLAVLAAHMLLAAGTAASHGLLNEIRRFLHYGVLTDHPDVAALMIGTEFEKPTPEQNRLPLAYPPSLRAGLRLISSAAAARHGVIAPGSPLAALEEQVVLADSAWTSWLDPPSRPTTSPQPVGDQPDALLPPEIPVFVEAFPASAPVYPLAEFESKSQSEAEAEGATLAVHAAIISAAGGALAAMATGDSSALTINISNDLDTLLEMSPEEVSQLTGVALDTVADAIAALKQTQPGEAIVALPALRRPLEILTAAVKALCASTVAANAESPGTAITPIETLVDRLVDEAATLDAIDGVRAASLRKLSNRLLKQAHYVVVADETGRLRYANRLLRDYLADQGEAALAMIATMRSVLAGVSTDDTEVAASVLQPKDTGAGMKRFDVRRKRMEDKSGMLLGHVYTIRDGSVAAMDQTTLFQVDALLSQVTLYSSMAKFATGAGRNYRLKALDSIVAGLKAIVPSK